jgi:uncharacterized Fe-S cluster-containing radical SAM superfamily enzyme
VERRREIYFLDGVPQVGTRYYGIVDQGTNVVEVRPTSLCPLNCVFCSVAAGPLEGRRWADFTVKKDALVDALKAVVRYKGDGVEVHIDGMGEPAVYSDLVDLVQDVKSIRGVSVASMQSRMFTLTERSVEELAEAGLDRINLSLDAVDPPLAARLANAGYYDPRRAMALAEYAVRNTSIDVVVSPVWLPGVNDDQMPKIARWAKAAGLGKRWPPVLIQKYIPHRRGRNPRGVKAVDWGAFWSRIRAWEAQLGMKLDWRGENPFGVERRAELPKPIKAGQRIKVRIVGRGVFRNEYLAVPNRLADDPLVDRAVTVISEKPLKPDDEAVVRVFEDEDNILMARAEVVFL